MASLITGYEYDIFISYRQKDNKGDRWVSEFVEALKTELESTFKEEISVYFDINPHDGLLETHDVDASLKNKLKCLVFVPIISRTYCDPKSFAWEHEFKAFVEQASNSQFGLKVKLPNGNVANRVLPIRIHDLDNEDIKLCESVLGGVIRGVEFIYKESGVNRPLRSNEENPHDNLNHTIYRNQINKVALAVKDIIENIKVTAFQEQSEKKEIQEKVIKENELIKVEGSAGKKTIKSKNEVQLSKIKIRKERKFQLSGRSYILILGILATIVILGTSIYTLVSHSRIKWAKEKALPEIEKLYYEENQIAAFDLIQTAEKYISEDPKLREWVSKVTSRLTVITDPPGTDVFIRSYSDTEGVWKKLGVTPIDSIKMPSYTFYQLRLEKSGYENILAVTRTGTGTDTLFRKLFKPEEIPSGMVYVEGYRNELYGNFLKEKNGFFIDRYEVTNKQFKEFVDKGGYSKPEYWKNEFIKEGKKLTREEAMTYFTDKTGRLGPLTWEAEDYPDGQDDYPVTGVSWYEAAAYAEYAGKSLPTAEHWSSGVGFYVPNINHYNGPDKIPLGNLDSKSHLPARIQWISNLGSKIVPLSNFNGKGPEPVGKFKGISCFGSYDMAGNVREWCWNETTVGRIVRGGAWDDATYLYSFMSQLPSFDRSPKNGFRCVQYIEKEKIPESAFQQIKYIGERDFSKEVPVPENIFTIYKNLYLYDSTDLQSVIEKRDNSYEDWTMEKITFNAAYGKERVIAYLFLPRNTPPPFQTLIYWHGLDALWERDLIKTYWQSDVEFLLKSRRAVMCPIYKGTFERIDKDEPVILEGHQLTEWIIKWVKDFRRSIDYLETRSDIDKSKLGFYGTSWGGMMGSSIPAVEDRLAVNILICGGFGDWPLPEVNAINYVSRIKIPTLMLNGRYDYTFPYEKTVLPLFNLLGTPGKDKRLCVYKTDHHVPYSEMIKEVLNWCDKYFGPVNHLQ